MSRTPKSDEQEAARNEQAQRRAGKDGRASDGLADDPSGFARMDKDKLRRWASYGGMVAQRSGLAHRFTSDTAREAGQKGGLVIARDRARMVELGRRGGIAKRENRRRREEEAALLRSGGDELLTDDGERAADIPQVEAGTQLGERSLVEIADSAERRASPRRHRKDA